MDLCELAQSHSVAGDEQAVRNLLIPAVRPLCDALYVDSMGNLIAEKDKQLQRPSVMLAAHMDEPGLMVAGIHESGLLYCKKIGSLDEQTLLGSRVAVGSRGIPGVIGGKPVHLLQDEERRKMPKVSDIFVDIGATDKKNAEALVHVGDYAAFATQYATFGAGLAKGKALGARSGCYALYQVLSALSADMRSLPAFPLYSVFTVQKEIGLRGARIAAYRLNPQIAIVIGAAPAADVPGVPAHQQGVRLGAGPALSTMDRSSISDAGLSSWLAQLASAAGIPVQWQQPADFTNDAGSIQQTRSGVRTVSIAIPCRYPGGPVSVVAQSDIANTVRLITTALTQIAREGYRP